MIPRIVSTTPRDREMIGAFQISPTILMLVNPEVLERARLSAIQRLNQAFTDQIQKMQRGEPW